MNLKVIAVNADSNPDDRGFVAAAKFKVIDVDTGKEICGVRRVEYVLDVEQLIPVLKIEVFGAQAEIEANGEIIVHVN